MKVVVEGFEDHIADEIIKSAQFYSKVLLHEKLDSGLFVYVQRTPILDSFLARTFFEDKNTFSIEIRDSQDDDNVLQTLAHELVHVKQWATRELVTIFDRSSPLQWIDIWRGREWKPKAFEDPYLDSPWEIEAMGREQTLYYRWMKYKGKL